MTEWTPIDHRPPLRRIGINDPVPVTPAPARSFLEIEEENAEDRRKAAEALRIWRCVEATARATNQPGGVERALDAFDGVGGCQVAPLSEKRTSEAVAGAERPYMTLEEYGRMLRSLYDDGPISDDVRREG